MPQTRGNARACPHYRTLALDYVMAWRWLLWGLLAAGCGGRGSGAPDASAPGIDAPPATETSIRVIVSSSFVGATMRLNGDAQAITDS